jgi:hypothetical protein
LPRTTSPSDVGSATGSIIASSSGMVVGAREDGGLAAVRGVYLADVRLFGSVLSDTDLLYESGRGVPAPAPKPPAPEPAPPPAPPLPPPPPQPPLLGGPRLHYSPPCLHGQALPPPSPYRGGGPHDIAGGIFDPVKNTYHIFPGCWTYLWNIPVHDRHGDAGAGGWLHATTQDLVHYKTETIHPFGGSGGTALDDDGHVVAWFSDDALQCRHGPGCHPNASSTATVKQDRAAAANAPELGVTMLAAKALDSSLEKWSNTTTQVNVLDTRAASCPSRCMRLPYTHT